MFFSLLLRVRIKKDMEDQYCEKALEEGGGGMMIMMMMMMVGQ